MIEKIARKIARSQAKNPKAYLLVFAIITIILLPGILNLLNNVEPSLEKILPQEIEEVKTMNDMRTQFGADMMYLIVYPIDPIYDARDSQLLTYVDMLGNKLEGHNSILRVTTLADEVRQLNNGTLPDTISKVRLLPISNRLVNSDYSMTIIEIKSDTGSSASKIKETVDAIKSDIASLDSLNPGVEIEITGFNAIDKATFEVIMSDFGSITGVALLLVALVVFITFRSLAKAMMPMVVVMVALIWTMGIAGYLNLTMTVVSMVSAAMIMGLGIDFGIHVVHTYLENRKKYNSDEALEETVSELSRAMIGASLTTMAGFLALLFGVLPAMKTLAIILAMGIFTTLLGALFLLPVIVYLYDTRDKKL